MVKRIKYKIGDIFLIPLEGDLKGVGRVLINIEAIVFIELYRIKPIKDASEFNFEEAIKEKPISMSWSYDTSLRNGSWIIFDNKPVEGEIDMPYFLRRDDDMKPYIMKGRKDSHQTFGECIYIPEEDVEKYEWEGIGSGGEAERKYYIYKLRRIGLM